MDLQELEDRNLEMVATPVNAQADQDLCHGFVRLVGHALPVMLAYLSIGVPCGVMESMVGFNPLMAFLFSVTYYSGAGQFMLSRMVLASSPVMAIATTISFMNTRQILYSAAFAPYFAGEGLLPSLGFAATVTDETFGINMDRFAQDPAWRAHHGIVVNICCMLSWASANALGCALGPVIDLPLALMSFGMTSIFICLAASQELNATTTTVMVVTAVAVAVLKLVGLGGVAVLVGSIAGVVAGLLQKAVGRQ